MVDATSGVSFADVDIANLGAAATGVDLTSLNGALSFATLDITGSSTTGTRGIDLTGATFASDAVTVESGTITGVDIGVDLTNAAIGGLFQYGDGSNTDADGAASTIDAVTPIIFTGLSAGTGTYDFEDVNLVGDTTAFSIDAFFVLDGATGSGTRLDPGSLAAAENAAADVIVLLNDPTGGTDTIDAVGSNGDDTFALDDDQQVFAFAGGDTLPGVSMAPANLLTFGVSTDLTNPFAGSGAPVLTATGASNTITLSNNNSLTGLTIGGAAAAISGASIDSFAFDNLTIDAAAGVSLTSVTGAGLIEDTSITTSAGIGILVDNSLLMANEFTLTTTGVSIDATGGDALDLDPLTVDATFTTITSTGGFQGIALDEVFGTFTVTGAVDVSNTTDDGIDIATAASMFPSSAT